MKKYVRATTCTQATARQRNFAKRAGDAIWDFQSLGEFVDPQYDCCLTPEDIDILDSARAILHRIAES